MKSRKQDPTSPLQERASNDLKTSGLHPFEVFPLPMNATLGTQWQQGGNTWMAPELGRANSGLLALAML